MENQMGELAQGSRGLFGQAPTFVGHIQWVSHKFSCVCTTRWDGRESCFCHKEHPLCCHIVLWHPRWQLLGEKRGVPCSQQQGCGVEEHCWVTHYLDFGPAAEGGQSFMTHFTQLFLLRCSFPFSSCWQSGAFLHCLGALHAALKD